jgi:hypothetical protein
VNQFVSAAFVRALMPNEQARKIADPINLALQQQAKNGRSSQDLKLLLPQWAQNQYDAWVDEALAGGDNLLVTIRKGLIASGFTVSVDKKQKQITVWW